MPRSRFRFAVRGMIVATALSAIFLGVCAWIEGWRSRFLAVAGLHHSRIACVFFGHPEPDGEYVYEATSSPQKSGDPPVSPRRRRIDTWHRQIAVKYWEAAAHPWLPVAPDPPEPE